MTMDTNSKLHLAALRGNIRDVRELLSTNVDINSRNKNRYTPLHYACRNGHIEVVRLLLDKGADVNAKSNDGYTPLHDAINKEHIEIVRLLLDRGADINLKPIYGYYLEISPEIQKLLEWYTDPPDIKEPDCL